MIRTLFNYQLNIKEGDYSQMANLVDAYKKDYIKYQHLSLKLNELFEIFFSKDPEFNQIIEAARTNHVLVHLVSQNNEVLELPWQLFFDQFPLIGLSKGNAPINEIYPTRLNSRLKVLILLSSPVNARPLDIKDETRTVLSGFMNNEIDVTITDDGSVESLSRALKNEDFDIVYYSGHGIYKNGETILSFESRLLREEVDVTGKEFVNILLNNCKSMPQLVILSSCYSGKGAIGFEGVTNLLLQSQIPAVVSFSDVIKEHIASYFCGNLALQLAKRYDIVNAFKFSINLLREGNLKGSYWILPQLYLAKHIEKLVSFETRQAPDLNTVSCMLEVNKYIPYLHKKEISFLARKLFKGNSKINITGHRGVGKTSIVNYVLQNSQIFTPDLRLIKLQGNNISIEFLAKELNKIGGKNTGNLLKDLSECTRQFPLAIVIDQIDHLITFRDGYFILELEILEIINKVQDLSLVVITRIPLLNNSYEILKVDDITIPNLFFLFKESYLGKYVQQKFPNSFSNNVFNSTQLNQVIRELFVKCGFGGILELYFIFEDTLKKYPTNIKSYYDALDFISIHKTAIEIILDNYIRNSNKKYGYNLFYYLNFLDINVTIRASTHY
jgi:Cdc6-like AAA superfamily ATPase